MSAATIALLLATATGGAQHERCTPRERAPEFACIERQGDCIELRIDGQVTTPLRDEGLAARVHALPHGENVCWQLAQPVSNRFRVVARGGGAEPAFVGAVHGIGVILFPLDDYDPTLDTDIEGLLDQKLDADAYRNGSWQLYSPRALPGGEYIAVFRVDGEDNWDEQAVLLRLDPALEPGPVVEGSR
jgi:hypothetical protein